MRRSHGLHHHPKLRDWEGRLKAYIDRTLVAQFAWGKNDCASFAARAVKAQTGWLPAPKILRFYNDEAGARTIIRAHGSLDKIVDRYLPRLDKKLYARRGDVCGFVEDDELRLGIILGELLATRGERGFAHRPLSFVTIVWRVG